MNRRGGNSEDREDLLLRLGVMRPIVIFPGGRVNEITGEAELIEFCELRKRPFGQG